MLLRVSRLLALIAVVLPSPLLLSTSAWSSSFKSSSRVSTAALFSASNAVSSSTTTTVASSSSTITVGDTVTFTATVTVNPPGTGTPTGLVTFLDGTTPLGSGTLSVVSGNDQTTFPVSVLSLGSHSITAVYDGDASFSASPLSSAIVVAVQSRSNTTALALNPTTVVVGQTTTATVTVTDAGTSFPPGTPGSFASTGAPATGRTGFTATLFADGQVLVVGGTDANGNVLQSAEIYSVTGAAFSATGNLNHARTGAQAVLLPNGKVLIAGGSSDGTPGGALNTAELFDPVSGTFTLTSQNMNAARFGFMASLLKDGQVLLAGGENSGGVLNSAELYNPATDTFTACASMNTARTGASATRLTGDFGEFVLIAGGSSDGTAAGALDTGEVFIATLNNGAGAFHTIVGTLSVPRWQPEAVTLPIGTDVVSKTVIAGGRNSTGALTSVDFVTAERGRPIIFSSSTAQLAVARANGPALLLPNSMTLLAGGAGGSQVAELYAFLPNQFVTTGNLLQSDNGLSLTLLNNGQVLAIGLTSGATPASDAELYTPTFNPLGESGFTSSDGTDIFTSICAFVPINTTASTCTTPITPANVDTNPHVITAIFNSNASANLTVHPATTTAGVVSSLNPSVFGQAVTFTATISDSSVGSTAVPTGAVQFVVDGANFGSPVTLASASASSSTATISPGELAVSGSPHTVTANYVNAGGNFINSAGSLSGGQRVSAAATSAVVASSLLSSTYGQAVSFSVTVTNTVTGAAAAPTGTVQFVVDGQNFGTPVTLTPGASGSSTATSGSTTTLTVNNGSLHTVAVNYTNTDKNFLNTTGSLSGGQKVNPAPLTLTANSVAIIYDAATFTGFTASLSGFVNGETEAGLRSSGALSGAAGFAGPAVGAVNAGTYTINPTSGTLTASNYDFANLQSGGLIIVKAQTTSQTTVLATPVNNTTNAADLVFLVVVSSLTGGTPTGSVLLTDDQNSAVSANVSLAPSACPSGAPATGSCAKFSFAPGQLVTGSQTISANYQGDNNFDSTSSGSTPSSAEVTIVPAINTSPGQTIPPQTITFDNAAALAGQFITLSCSVQAATIPASSDFPQCSLSTTTLPGDGTVIVNISTVAPSNAGLLGPPTTLASSAAVLGMPAFGVLGLVMIGGAGKSGQRGGRTRILPGLMLMLCIFLLLLAAGCGASVTPPPPPPPTAGTPSGTYLVSVIGTDVNHNQVLVATIPLNVQ